MCEFVRSTNVVHLPRPQRMSKYYGILCPSVCEDMCIELHGNGNLSGQSERMRGLKLSNLSHRRLSVTLAKPKWQNL